MSSERVSALASGPVVVFDLSSLRFCRKDNGLVLLTRAGEQLAFIQDVPSDLRQAAALILTEAAARGRVWRDGVACRIGLYHPQTGEVEIGAYPKCVTLRGDEPVALDAEGTLGHWDDGDLVIGEVLSAPVEIDDGELIGRLLSGVH